MGQQWQAEISEPARRRLRKLPKFIQEAIARRIDWLRDNADAVNHERMTGTDEYSLHVGQYRVLYLLDYERRLITVVDLGKHDEVYRRLRKR